MIVRLNIIIIKIIMSFKVVLRKIQHIKASSKQPVLMSSFLKTVHECEKLFESCLID